MKKLVKILSFALVIIFVFSYNVFAKEEETYPVEIKAKSAILMDCTSGKVLMKMNEHTKLPPASVTKIMPMLLVVEKIAEGEISLSDKVKTSAHAASKGGSQIWLKENEEMTVDELLKAVAVASANDACCALGEYIAGSEQAFIRLMNNRAKELGMNDTTFVNCSGLDDTETNYTSAYDIAVMSRELMKYEDLITKYTTIWMDNLRNGETELVNTNKLVRFYPGTTGLKTGTTSKAGCCLSATAKRDNLHLVAVVMGSENSQDRFETAKAMLNWGFSNYESIKPVIDKKLITDVIVEKGAEKSVRPAIPQTENILVKKGKAKDIIQTINLAIAVTAPVEKGQTLGTVEFSLDGEKLAEYSLLSPENIEPLKLPLAFRRLLMKLI
ncbi:MAG: D-alanyl-D-alanine carboxypeptidase [Clostridia bacterium]|nr:D-alanyl-D-alanine carboxypeptidase [Clostridia bacterium]